MKALKQLVQLLDVYKLRSIEIIGLSERTSNVNTFYKKIADNSIHSDEEAAQLFFKKEPNYKAYQKLKSNLKKRLINSLFLVNIKQARYSERQKAYYQCHKDWAAVNILLGKNAWDIGIGICLKILKQAKKFEFTSLRLESLRIMRIYYGTRLGDIERVNKYSQELENVEQLNILENWCEGIYVKFVSQYVLDRSTKKNITSEATKSLKIIKERVGTTDSYSISLYQLLIELLIYTSVNDYSSTAEVCEKAFEKFHAKAYIASVPLQVLYYQLIICHTQLGNFNKGYEIIELGNNFTEKGSFNWFKYQELILQFYLHAKDYKKALDCYLRAVQHRNFKSFPEALKEIWYLFGGYLVFLYRIGALDEEEQHQLASFRKGKFLNEVPNMLRDKSGMGISVLVLELLFLVLERAHESLLDRIESVRKYCARHLQKEDTKRSECFLKMLLCIPKNGFQKGRVQHATASLKLTLEAQPLASARQPHELEVIPYEDLWSFILEHLDQDRRSLV